VKSVDSAGLSIIDSFRGLLINAPPVTAMAATPLRFTIEQLRLSEASPRYAVYCSRKLADATKVDVLDDISPLPGTVGLRTVPSLATRTIFWKSVEYQARGRARRNCGLPSNGKLHHGVKTGTYTEGTRRRWPSKLCDQLLIPLRIYKSKDTILQRNRACWAQSPCSGEREQPHENADSVPRASPANRSAIVRSAR
jgi:hypothetical protein